MTEPGIFSVLKNPLYCSCVFYIECNRFHKLAYYLYYKNTLAASAAGLGSPVSEMKGLGGLHSVHDWFARRSNFFLFAFTDLVLVHNFQDLLLQCRTTATPFHAARLFCYLWCIIWWGQEYIRNGWLSTWAELFENTAFWNVFYFLLINIYIDA